MICHYQGRCVLIHSQIIRDVPEWFFQPVAEKFGFAGTGISSYAHIGQNRLQNQRQCEPKVYKKLVKPYR
jgi:hypothetical protein